MFTGAFRNDDPMQFLLESRASFQNPFLPQRQCHWFICPSHQMKNMLSALFSSHPDRAKQFERSGVKFGWLDIETLKVREDERVKEGLLRFVLGLLNSYIERDAWTKLNVKPAKIFQQENVLSELLSHAKSLQNSNNSSCMQVYLYLNAVNKIFERGLLSQYPVYDVNSPNAKLILEGFKYFVDWYQEIATSTDSNDKQSFLTRQTWDLLQVLISGMKALIADFTARHPDYFFVLSRINGSVVESLLSIEI